MRHPGLIVPLLLALAGCDVEPASERTFDTTALADVGADLLAPDGANPEGCPAAEPAPNGACVGVDTCSYGQECCCGQCSASFVCTCAAGSWACYYTDFCLRPGCDDATAPDASADATWGDTTEDLAANDASDATVGSDDGDVPAYDVAKDVDDACPAEVPLGLQGGACESGQRCKYGQECCCGECAPSMVCECFGGAWGCHSTDFCLIPGCPDDTPPEGQCRTEGDCQDGASCRDADQPMPCGICRHPETACGDDAACQPGEVCEQIVPPRLCLCEATALCVPACTAETGCPVGQACVAGHCAAATCASEISCPTFFTCDVGTGACSRQPCTSDAECGPGHCVNERCFAEFGSCQLPVP